jgi:DNA-binding transcriptional ArsR family regulator
MPTRAAPSLLPILRSRLQGQVLAWLLDDPTREASASELARKFEASQPSVHRELSRLSASGILTSRLVGPVRLFTANQDSVLNPSLRTLLVRSFGPPALLADALIDVPGVTAVYIFGSWAAAFEGLPRPRAPHDIDVLVVGSANRDQVYQKIYPLETILGREIQVQHVKSDWIEAGQGSFHDTVLSRPLVPVLLPETPVVEAEEPLTKATS